MAEETISKELDALKNDIAQLRKDIAGLATAVKDVASDRVAGAKASARGRISETWDDVERRFNDAVGSGKEAYHTAEQKISQHPTASVVTAFGIGFLIAKLLDMGERR